MKIILIVICVWVGVSLLVNRNNIDLAPFKKDFQLLGKWIIDKFNR